MTIHNMYAKRYVTFEYVPLIGHWSCTSALKLHCHVLAPIGAAKSGLDLPISHNVTTSPLCCSITKMARCLQICRQNFHKYWFGRCQVNKRTPVMQRRTSINAHSNVGQRAIMQHQETVARAPALSVWFLVCIGFWFSESTAVINSNYSREAVPGKCN